MKVETLFGGSTRYTILETLAGAKKPITAYQIAMTRGLDPAATYRCLTELLEFRIVESQRKNKNQTFYKLSDGPGRALAVFLNSLKQKTARPADLEEWISPQMRAQRMAKIIRLDRKNTSKIRNQEEKQGIGKIMSKRIPGELSALITSSKIAFDELFEQKNGVFILRAR
jgi:Fe2+ or Zn2+ uptake regulation protein